MLLQFNFENYKSFLEDTTLDLTATSIKEHNGNLIEYFNNEKYLKTLAIYGANASGKSNIFDAFLFMRNMVLNLYSIKVESKYKKVPVNGFRLNDDGKTKASTFEVFFTAEELEYQYGFSLTNNAICSEWLYKRDYNYKEKYITVLEKDNDSLILSPELEVSRELIKAVDDKTLVLSVIYPLGLEDVRNVIDWFSRTFVFSFGDPQNEHNFEKILNNSRYFLVNEVQRLEDFLKAVDVGIEGLRFEYPDDSDFSMASENQNMQKIKVFTRHKTSTGKYEEFSLSEESSGTRKMFSLYNMISYALDKGTTLFIDELDAKLHPLLTRYIINMFQNKSINKNNAQLIFSVHDTSCLNKDMFRRDQINFVEKDEFGVSRIKPLNKFEINGKKVRNDASYSKDYLFGMYGAIPNLADFEIKD